MSGEHEAYAFLGCFTATAGLIGWIFFLLAGQEGVAVVVAVVLLIVLLAVLNG